MNSITEKTTISIGLLVSLMGICSWLTSVWADNRQNGREIISLKHELSHRDAVTAEKDQADEKFRTEVIDRLARIETSIKRHERHD